MKVVERSGSTAVYSEDAPMFGRPDLTGAFTRRAYVARFSKPRPKERHALEVLRRLGGARYRQWMRESGISTGYFDKVRKRLLERGLIKQTDDGYYCVREV